MIKVNTPKDAIYSPESAYKSVPKKEIKWDRENFLVILLDGENKPKKALIEFVGGRSSVKVDVSLTFKNAIIEGTKSIILAHNHPEFENLKPSREDISLTRKLQEAADILEIEILDHLIFNESTYYSMKSKGDM